MDFLNDFHQLSPLGRGLFLVWLTVVGAAVGSFLNVVVYRLPLGKSVVRPGSFCPRCLTPIRWYDNLPVLSWFFLRGRCRTCHEPISFRYPLVEAVTAVLFFVLTYAELLSHAANLPLRAIEVSDGLITPLRSTGLVIGLYCYHLTLLVTLLTAGLIEWDGQKVPRRCYLPAWIFGLIGPLFYPGLHPIGVSVELTGPVAGLVDNLAGLACGAAAGGLLILFRLPVPEMPDRRNTLTALSLTGLYLGYQMTLQLFLPLVALWLFGTLVLRIVKTKRTLPEPLVLVPLVLLALVFWNTLS